MQRLIDLLKENDGCLLVKLIDYAIKSGFSTYSSTLVGLWRTTVAELSDTIIQLLKEAPGLPRIMVTHTFANEPLLQYVTSEATKHCLRGIDMNMFIGVFKYCRRAYIEIINEANFDLQYHVFCQSSINDVFDKMELAIISKYLELMNDEETTKLQEMNRLLTNEKNSYVTLYESLPIPIIFYNEDFEIISMNLATSDLFGVPANPGSYYYGAKYSIISLGFLQEHLLMFEASSASELAFEKTILVGDEIKCFEIKITHMLDASKKFNGYLVIMSDVTDHKKVTASKVLLLQQQMTTKMAMARSVAEERERCRISSYLHDNVGQSLLLAKIKLECILESHNETGYKNELETILAIQDEIIQSVRSLSQQLCPPILYNIGLEAALSWLCKQIKTNYSLNVTFFDDHEEKTLSEDMRAIVFQSCRELLINVAKHAKCSSAQLAVTKEKDIFKLIVTDSGIGFVHPAEITGENGLGLYLIQERIKHMGGETIIESSPGNGTYVCIQIPL
jgi:signal transduction histidine kinase